MPKIVEYGAPQGLDLTPSETGIQATAAAARRVQGAFNESAAALKEIAADKTAEGRRIGSAIEGAGGVAVKFAEHREISHGASAFTSFMAAKAQNWNELAKSSDPNDPTIAGKFMEGLDQDLEKFRTGFLTEGGQRWAEAHVDSFRNHMSTSTTADMSTLARQATHENVMQTANTLSATAATDPSSVKFLLGQADSIVGGVVASSPNLSAADAGRARSELTQHIKEQIAKAGVMAAISRNPEAGLRMANDPALSGFINGAEIKQFEHAARMQQRMDLAERRQVQIFQHQENVREFNSAATKNFTDNVAYEDGQLRVKPDYFKNMISLAKMPDATVEHVASLTRFGEYLQQRTEIDARRMSNPDVVSGLTERLFDPDQPTTLDDIVRAHMDSDPAKRISDRDFSRLKQSVDLITKEPLRDPLLKDALRSAKGALTYQMPGLPGKDPKGLQAYSSFLQDFLPLYAAQKRAGTLLPNALDFKDEGSLVSQFLRQYRRSPKQMLDDRLEEYRTLGVSSPDGTVVPPASPAPGLPRPTNAAERDNLPKGTHYLWTDGTKRTRQ